MSRKLYNLQKSEKFDPMWMMGWGGGGGGYEVNISSLGNLTCREFF